MGFNGRFMGIPSLIWTVLDKEFLAKVIFVPGQPALMLDTQKDET